MLLPYLRSTDVNRRIRGVQALRWMPKSSFNQEVYRQLEHFTMVDEVKEVSKVAAATICQRGNISKLTSLLEYSELPQMSRNRLIEPSQRRVTYRELGCRFSVPSAALTRDV